MSSFGSVLRSLVASVRRQTATLTGTDARSAPVERKQRAADNHGRPAEFATVEVDPASVGRVRMTYVPSTDGDPDPGEIVWTWVPYEERDGRGKDRPVLIVAEEPAGTRLAVQLTSKPHDDSRDFVSIGIGPWDQQGRPSWVNVGRVFRVHPLGMRREASAIDKSSYVGVAAALKDRYRWH
ncbi:type II toxin-antitoxin system PemK/MazF family toxin [Mycetocola zhujimingii]|uniref:Growth inhibitor PemK n=1 Tax=Mycetocola zhujimingii TaxID=2079792 RepID=A0A2U1TGM5_9MICO|nr:type II toxin-antitoxin system PemK/MazF family toxin [Mycetocola zhujimingii]PWC08035.1 growth inhibitor PemK [Mycetocola zhujimingii]